MRSIGQKIMGCGLLLGISACSGIEDLALTKDVENFSHGTAALSQIISATFDLAEKANAIATVSNIQFQLDLGGHPDTTIKQLFSASEQAKRRDALNLLTGYANALEAVISNPSADNGDFSVPAAVSSVKSFDYRDFDLTHTLQVDDAKTLVQGLSIFEELFIFPKRDKALAKIVKTGDAAIRRLALLLYIDIGETADQSPDCSYKAPSRDIDTDISNLRLCRGGLRAVVDSAFSDELNIWKSKLSLLSGTTAAGQSAIRSKVVQRIVAIQKADRLTDQLLAGSQAALISMVSAHADLLDLLDPTQQHQSVNQLLPTQAVIFLEKVAALAASVKVTGAAIDALEDSSTPYKDLSSTKGDQNVE